MKYWMISGVLLDFSSTSVNTSNTSKADVKKKQTALLLIVIHTQIYTCEIAAMFVTLDGLSSRHLLQVHCHVTHTQ